MHNTATVASYVHGVMGRLERLATPQEQKHWKPLLCQLAHEASSAKTATDIDASLLALHKMAKKCDKIFEAKIDAKVNKFGWISIALLMCAIVSAPIIKILPIFSIENADLLRSKSTEELAVPTPRDFMSKCVFIGGFVQMLVVAMVTSVYTDVMKNGPLSAPRIVWDLARAKRYLAVL